MQKLTKFIKSYPLVSVAIGLLLCGAVLSAAGHSSITNHLLSGFSLIMAVHLSLGMLRTLKKGRYGIDILAVAAIISTVLVGEYWASIIIVLMLTGGEALEDYAANRAKRELSALLERSPKNAHKIIGTKIKTVNLSEVAVGDLLLVKPWEVVPVDATLEDGIGEFDESSLTGESLPVEHSKGDQLLSGSVNGGETVKIRATKSAQDSQYQQIVKLVKAASSSQAPFVRLADRYAIPFTVISFIIASTAWAASGESVRFAEVLVIATPCPLLLGAPIALISGMSRAAKNGIIVKNGGVLERLATIRSVAFDKTGTLTRGEPVVSGLEPTSKFNDDDLLLYAASAEQQSNHVLSQALVSYAKERKIKLLTPAALKEVTAQGIIAKINDKKVLIGKQEFLQQEGIDFSKHANKAGETAVYVAIHGEFAGIISFRDEVRPETKQTLSNLLSLGINHTVMLTGDTRATAERIASEIGITDIQAECLPADKVAAIKDKLKDRPVMMVGDGVNDAPVLAVADVGMAMGARGSTAASETADVVVLVDDLSKSYQAIRIAKDTIHIALQGIWIGIAISVGLMLVASTGAIPAVAGALLQELVDVVVIFNALRAHGPWRTAAQ